MTNKKVSILVAAYNIEKFIGKCIESIIHQTYQNLEIIVVNDHSSDMTETICKKYLDMDNRIKLISHEKNSRLPAVRNTGLSAATGDYIVFVDGDDWLAEDFVEYMVELIEKTESDFAISLNCFTTIDHEQIKKDFFEVWGNEKTTAELLYPHVTIGAWNKIYKRSFIEKNNLRFRSDHFTAEGFRFIFEAAQLAKSVGVGKRKVYYYRLNNINSATTKPDIRQGTGSLYALDCMERDMIIKSPLIIDALHEHMWIDNNYVIRIIVELNKEKEYAEILNKSVEYVRRNGFIVARKTNCFRNKVKFILGSVFPIGFAHYQVHRKKKKLQKDLKVMQL